MADFIHLRSHSSYSICDGLSTPAALIRQAKELGYPALALTDEGNLFAARNFFDRAREQGIKPLLGMDLFISDDAARYRVTALVVNKQGYENLMQLATYAQTVSAHDYHRGCVPRSLLAKHCAGLIILSGAAEGDVGSALVRGDREAAIAHLRWWLELCGDNYYLELQRLGRENEEVIITETLLLAEQHSCPPVATNSVCFLTAADFDMHHLRVCIHHNQTIDQPKRQHQYLATQYLRPPAEMAELFADIPAALENALLIARKCSFFLKRELHLPVFPAAADKDTKVLLRELAYEGIAQLLGSEWKTLKEGEYQSRLDMELKVIADMGYSDYFLIVADFVRWAKSQQIAVGPGRGSAAGSLVSYAISITALDPLVHNLLFERFLNPGRGSMPDFDIDVCMERRDEVIEYIRNTYGEEAAVQIISFGTMGARAAIRDVTRVLNKPFGLGDKIARLIPEMPGVTLANALKGQPDLEEFIQQDEEAKHIFACAQKLEGTVRHTGSHAAGLVITSGKVAEHCPLYADDKDNLLTQFDKDDLEAQGLIKFDILGLRTLTVIDDCLRMIKQHENKQLRMTELDLADEDTFRLISSGQTYAVFQLESSGMRDVARQMKPKSFEDIVALIALFRPGPMKLIDSFIKNKQTIEAGKTIDYPHPKLETILRPTYGIPVYQEQIMQMAQALAGFSLSKADELRHAMGKKKKAVMQSQQQAFIEGAKQQDIKQQDANRLFDMIEEFAGYGFNRSHSVGYALLAYWTAYLKTHHPQSFLAAYMTSEGNNHKKLARLVEEAQRLDINVLPPDINQSMAEFSLTDHGKTIRYSLAAVKGVGRRAARAVVTERAQAPYSGFFDLCSRIEQKIVTRPLLESFVRCDALHSLEPNQALLMSNIERGIQHNKKRQADIAHAVGDMFASSLKHEMLVNSSDTKPWGPSRKLREERTALGFCLKGDAFSIYRNELRDYLKTGIADIKGQEEVTVCGRINHLRRILRPGKKDIVTFMLCDDKSSITTRVLAAAYTHKTHLLAEDKIIVIKGYLNSYNNSPILQANSIHGLEYLRVIHCNSLCLIIDERHITQQRLTTLREILLTFVHKAGLPLYLQLMTDKKNYRVRFLKNSHIIPSNDCLGKIEELFPEAKIFLPLKT